MLKPSTLSALQSRPRVPLNERIALTLQDVADATSLSETTLKQLVRDGVLKPSKVGRRTLFDPRQVQEAIFGSQQ